MKILKFSAQNIKGIKVVEISPDGDVVTLSGKNGAGKSTVLDAIQNTLTGGKLPIRNGEEKARVEIDLGEYVVQRLITDKTDRLVIRNKEGATYPSPRDFLSNFIGEISIDPLAFIRMKEKDQLNVLFQMNPGLKEKLAEADKKIDEIKTERSLVLREGKILQVDIGRYTYRVDPPTEEVSVQSLVDELTKAEEHNKKREGIERNIAITKLDQPTIEKDLSTALDKISSIQEKIKDLKQKQTDTDFIIVSLTKWCSIAAKL